MAIQDLKEQIARLPQQPGVYLWCNQAGDTIYVGKASVLRDRVRSYLNAGGLSPRHAALLKEITTVEVIVTDSVMEALALENNLIKQRSPKYNILLRDDKNYPYLQLTTTETFPRLRVARRVERGGDFYAGPFLPAKLARRTMGLAQRLFGIRSCNEVITGNRDRPCLEYDIKRCIAPCVSDICNEERYDEAVASVRLFLEGRDDELLVTLKNRMTDAAASEQYEEAAQMRDALRTVQVLRDRQQKVATPGLGNRDVFGLKVGPSGSVIQVFAMRGGRVVERLELIADPGGIAHTDADVMQAALQQFYEDRVPPSEISLPLGLEGMEAIAGWLSARAERRVRIGVPRRGDKRALVDLATRNAELVYRERFNKTTAAHFDALENLRVSIGLPVVPRRIECIDISTLQGSETVASMVVCEDGRMKSREYRRYRVGRFIAPSQEARSKPDDFAAMREVVQRRYQKVIDDGGPFPDLVVVDGGRGQLSAAYDALELIGLSHLVVVGLAKREELLYTRDRPEPLSLPTHDSSLLLLQHIRDEAHRFAVTFHRKARSMRDFGSVLNEVPGIGTRRRHTLLKTFGSLAAVRRATREELSSVVGTKAASAVIDYFSRQ